MARPTRVLFLEMDAGDKHLIKKWAGEGILPTFRSLLKRGLVGDTMAPEGFFVGGIWPSLYTGVTPARHGIHSLLQLNPGTYDFVHCPTGDHVKREPFWSTLSRSNKRVAILDIPLSGLSAELNGIQSVEWGAHDANYGFCAQPAEFEADLKARFGLHPWSHSCNAVERTQEGFINFRDALVQGVRKKAELTKHYLSQGSWDFFGQVFTESHCVGHQCWHLHDPSYPGHVSEIAAVVGDPIRDVYQAIDEAIGEILELVDDNTAVIVLAGHRMSHKFGAQFLLPEILDRLGVAKLRGEQSGQTALDRIDDVLTWGWQRTPRVVKRPLMGLRNKLRHAIDESGPARSLPPTVGKLDNANSKCFLMDNGFPVSGLRLNLEGREPRGLISPGVEQARFCAQLTEDLLALEDADSGVPMVVNVKKTADLYQGEYLDHLPDLLVAWNEKRALGNAICGNPAGSLVRVRSDKIGVVEGTNRYGRTGDHRPEGIFMALGRGVNAGSLGRTVSIMDFAPTFCELLDVPLGDVDGRPISEFIRPVLAQNGKVDA